MNESSADHNYNIIQSDQVLFIRMGSQKNYPQQHLPPLPLHPFLFQPTTTTRARMAAVVRSPGRTVVEINAPR